MSNQISLTKALSPKQQGVLYRALQEGLTNGIRHGNSSSFSFSLYESNDGIIFRLEDNGNGVDEVKPGIGLSTMKARVAEIGGENLYRIKKKEWDSQSKFVCHMNLSKG